MQTSKQIVDALGIEMPAAGIKRAVFLPTQVGNQSAEGGQTGHEARNEIALQAEDVGHLGNVAGGASAAADEEAVARVDALAHGDLLDGRDHVVVAGRGDRVRRFLAADAEPLRDPIDGAFCETAIELDAAAEKEVGIENAEHD